MSAQSRHDSGIPDSERVIAWGIGDATDQDTSLVVATDQALYEMRSGSRIAWQNVIKGSWEQPDFVIDFQGESGPPRLRIRLEDPRDLPAAVRDRVTDTVVISEYRDLTENAGAHFVARRSPGGGLDGISWSVVFDAGLDPNDQSLRVQADGILSELRGSLGI
ncbi:MAG: hypothetical protein O2815_08745 [Actinomycetota bacterium]|nr:hypothetical protein [Actinomycetota bacterium]